jgi:preprotein translocase subunit SecA
MLEKILRSLFGDKASKELNHYYPLVDDINEIYQGLADYSDDQLRERVNQIRQEIAEKLQPLREELAEIEHRYREEPDEVERTRLDNDIDRTKKELKQLTKSTLDSYLPEVFAIVKDTCRRLLGHKYDVRGHEVEWNMVPFDVQLIGGIALHDGKIAEMATGEGKTLVAVLPMFLNALVGRGVHLVTVNDYLAMRDSEWMSPVYQFHGLSVGCITTGLDFDERKQAYSCDITYGMNSEYGFDYLRDNMAVSADQLVQRDFYYAIVDEVDSILIDEARTPLIISGAIAQDKNFYPELKPAIQQLVSMQNSLVQKILTEIREDTKAENPNPDIERLGRNLLLVQRAAPKNKAFIKLMQDGELKKLVSDTEGVYLRDKKMHVLDNELYYVVEEKQNSVDLCDKGRDFLSRSDKDLFLVESLDELLAQVDNDETLSIEQKATKKEKVTNAFMDKSERLHNINQLLRAYSLFENNVEYVILDNKVVIVDEFTGRQMPGRRFSDGLHQALEAKENVTIEAGTQTLATVTLQNYFRMYEKLAGMTGTAVTEEGEFMEIYKLGVTVIPTNVPVTRIDHDDVIYLTKNEKYQAIIDEITYWHEKKKPVLVGTVSVEVSEVISRLLRRKNIPHNVLNAKYHEKEAEIIADAGQPGAVTIATNMAGRGTDIKLGKSVVTQPSEAYRNLSKSISEEYPYGIPLDGLHVIGSERHESRRIDRQLRGRAGRQGDPGTSRFYLSLEDDLMRLFGSDRMAPMMIKMGIKPGDAIRHPWMTKAVERAQKRVEEHNFEIRKNLLKYDEVMNQQREVIYSYRRNVLKGFSMKNEILEMMEDTIDYVVDSHIPEGSYPEDWNLEKLCNWFKNSLNVIITPEQLQSDHMTKANLTDELKELAHLAYREKEQRVGEDMMRDIERRSLLEVVDTEWRDHLHEMDLLKDGIYLRSYANKDPLIEYKKESFDLFQNLISRIQENVTKKVFTTYILSQAQLKSMLQNANMSHSELNAFLHAQETMEQENLQHPMPPEAMADAPKQRPITAQPKVGRNDPCPCGSGKKYKKCCGKMEFMNED